MRTAAIAFVVLAALFAQAQDRTLTPEEEKQLLQKAYPPPDLDAARQAAEQLAPAGTKVVVSDARAMDLLHQLGYEVRQQTTPAPIDVVPPTPPKTPTPAWVFVTIGCFGVATAATLLWVFVLLPRRRARPLREAIALLQAGEDPPLSQIESLLSRATSSGLRASDLATSRFLLAYVRARLGRHSEALTVLGESLDEQANPPDHVLYLDLWLKVKTRDWQGAERRWYESSALLEKFAEGAHLAGITFLELGRQSLTRKEYERALTCFDKVRKLGVLADRIPSQLANLELVLAISALFDREETLATQRFERLMEKAESEERSTLLPRIGLLLCRWRGEEYPDVDEELNEILAEAEKEADAADLLEPLTLWYAISLLFLWLRGPERKGLTTQHREALNARLERVRVRMPKRGDADLISGLLDYFSSNNDKQRSAALERIRKAVDAGVTLPEVLYLIETETRRAERDKNKADSYIALVKTYLSDSSVPVDMRRQLHEHLSQFERFRNAEDLIVPANDSAIAPSVHEVAASCALIEDRVRRLFRASDDDPKYEQIDLLLRNLNGSRDTLQKTVDELGKIEHQLMRSAGEALLPEDAPSIRVEPGA